MIAALLVSTYWSTPRLQDGIAFPELKKRYWGKHFWGKGYFSTTSGQITDDIILQYLVD